jgi:hypothetical protein
MPEQWLPVVNFEGVYEVSDEGQVRSLDRSSPCTSRWGKDFDRRYEGKTLRPGTKPGGYLFVGLYDMQGNAKYCMVHRLVAGAFIGPCPQGMEVAHNDGNKKTATCLICDMIPLKGTMLIKNYMGHSPVGAAALRRS